MDINNQIDNSRGSNVGSRFNYTYSAAQQEEIKNIRKKYAPAPEEDKLTQLRKLDNGITQKVTAVALIAGILGVLILGIGMCCTMVWQGMWFVPGIIIGIIGLVPVCLAYPLFNHVLKKEREKIAPEVLRLTDELMK